MSDHRARRALAEMGREFPTAWRRFDEFRRDRTGRPSWPDWCWMPIAGALAVVSGERSQLPAQFGPRDFASASRLAALGAWRITQRVYRYDPSLYAALVETPIEGDLPHQILHRLPDWCVYVETPGLRSAFGVPMAGAWVHLEYDVNTGGEEIRILPDQDGVAAAIQASFAVHLGPWSLTDAVERSIDLAMANASQRPLHHTVARAVAPHIDEMKERLRQTVEPLLSLVLYLCSERPDVGGQTWPPARPEPTRTRHYGERHFAPDQATTWEVGTRIGAAIRAAERAERPPVGEPGVHASPRPHVRRAHWHTYWVGPRNSPHRDTILRWIPPIAVNLDDWDHLATTVSPVIGERGD